MQASSIRNFVKRLVSEATKGVKSRSPSAPDKLSGRELIEHTLEPL